MAACQTLYENAHGNYVFINGSDGQWRTAECLRMMALRERYDLIVGRRRRKHYNWRRLAISAAFNLAPLALFGVCTHDAGQRQALSPRHPIHSPSEPVGRFAKRSESSAPRDAGLRVGVIDVDHFSRQSGTGGGAAYL